MDAVTPHVAIMPRIRNTVRTVKQGPTLVHISAQRMRILWDRGCV